VKGKVVCLRVSGNRADVAALLDQPFNGRTHVTLIILDLGNPATGQSGDRALFGFTSSPPAHCGSGGTLLGDASGNLVVNDAT
jgi:hypothetical protein